MKSSNASNELVLESKEIGRAKALLNQWEKREIFYISYCDPEFPERLRRIPDPPLGIFIKGAPNRLRKLQKSIAVVGTRKADTFGIELAQSYSEYLARRGYCIVSGLAHGIDTAAHRGALTGAEDLPTIAVLGSGLNTIYPAANAPLAKQILERGGLLISQFLPDEKPFPSNFLNRNRIIAGLSDQTLVIQAPEKSGALATARHAIEQGKDLLVIPGTINDPRYIGSNRLIKSGAYLVSERSDLNLYLGIEEPKVEETEELGAGETQIISLLKKHGTLHIELLKKQLCDLPQLETLLLELELSGTIRQEAGNLVRLAAK